MRSSWGLLVVLGVAGCDLVFPPGPGPGGDDVPGEWTAVSAGEQHACAIDRDQALWCWGRNDQNQLGDGTKDERTAPVRIGGTARWDSVSAGDFHSCGIQIDGGLYCWGDDRYGELGGGAVPAARSAPTPIAEPGPWREVSAGLWFTCAIKVDGTLWCWGGNMSGQLGVGGVAPTSTPTMIASPGPWDHVAAGGAFTCAIATDTVLWCWGDNAYGQLAYEPGIASELPVAVAAPGFTAITAGGAHACGVNAGQLACWGRNAEGEIGDGTVAPYGPAATVSAPGVDWLAVDAGYHHTCAIDGTGALYCWGQRLHGSLGDGDDGLSSEPFPIAIEPARRWSTVTTSVEFGCAIDADGVLACTGSNTHGQLGDGNGGARYAPVMVPGLAGATAIAVGGPEGGGDSFSCAMLPDGEYCWGANNYSQHGDGTTTPSRLPVKRDTQLATALDLGGWHGCELRSGALWCWGDDSYGQLGDGTTTVAPFPIPIAVGANPIVDVATMNHTCAIDDAHGLWCWGDNGHGQVGIGNVNPVGSPAQIGIMATDVAAGTRHTCAIDTDGYLECWGVNSSGELGLPDTMDRLYPELLNAAPGFTSIDVGGYHTCAIDDDSKLNCWGYNPYGAIGDGTFTTPTQPVPLNDGLWRQVAAGGYHTCAIEVDTTLWCWGGNWYGQAGVPGGHVALVIPTQVGTDHWITIDAGEAHTCGIKLDGTVWCWGSDEQGEIGDGSAWRPTFAPVGS